MAVSLTAWPAVFAQDSALRWWQPYTDAEANGEHVLGYWNFDAKDNFADKSRHQHQGTLRGAKWNAKGKFGGCLESSVGYPVIDESHSWHVKRSPVLSPAGAFTIEMWLNPHGGEDFPDQAAPALLDMKYVPTNHTGFMLSLSRSNKGGPRSFSLEIGLGSRSEKWYSRPVTLEAKQWRHLAVTYDGKGSTGFYLDGNDIGTSYKEGAGSMAAGVRDLAIGDRIGSWYRGFPGRIDEVRITSGVRELQPLHMALELKSYSFLRMSKGATLRAKLSNRTGAELNSATIRITTPGKGAGTAQPLPQLAESAGHTLEIPVDTRLRPGTYAAVVSVELPNWAGGDTPYPSTTRIPFTIVARQAERMPVVMWGLGGTEAVIEELPRLKEIGFTHCLGLRSDHSTVWAQGAEALPGTSEQILEGREMLNVALENDFKIVVPLSPARYLRDAEVGKPFLRVNRKGEPYGGRHDISASHPRIQDFCFHTGLAIGRAYGDHPAFDAALIHTEVRGESQVSFHPEEIEAAKKATGADIPAEITTKNGVQWAKLKNFPADRVIADDHPIRKFYAWFWQKGDGWNDANSRVDAGLKEGSGRDDLWTFHDPAVRVPAIGGSGGKVDVLSHWTYSYPDPIRIGLCADELLEMARASGRDQDVMKMTQLIWYRSQTAPQGKNITSNPSPWVDQDPSAAYITIAPMHLREAFWWKLSRPIQGIMYHGWQSLVETDSPGAYRYTNPSTQHELTRLLHEVIEPLGPTLMEIPDAASDVAFFESFTSHMFAGRATYGWNQSWAAEMYHVLMYAQLQPQVFYEESLLKQGALDGFKILVMPDCDVLTRSVVDKILAFQAAGGLVIGDAEICPAIQPDFTIERFARTRKAGADRKKLQQTAATLRTWLDERYQRKIDSSNPDVVTRRRTFGSSDYIFAVNDAREFGAYVGEFGRTMENGLPSETEVSVKGHVGAVYDLIANRQIDTIRHSDSLGIKLSLGPCEGRILMVTNEPIKDIAVTAPKAVAPGSTAKAKISVNAADKPIDAVVPVRVRIFDPAGIEGEFSGHYAAVGGQLELTLDFAPNDRLGIWEIAVEELASGKTTKAFVRLENAP